MTLSQVAERAGVSRSAASFVMNGRTDQRLAASTIDAVREAAAELGYRPNLTAQALRTGRTGTVALVSDFVSSTSFANAMIRGAMQELLAHDTLLFTVDTQGSAAAEEALLTNLLDRQVDGILYASMFTREVTVPPLLANTSVVLLNCIAADGTAIPSVVPDEVQAGATAARALLTAGHRDSIHFMGNFPPGVTGGARWHGWSPLALPERLSGVEAELATAGCTLADTWTTTEWDAPAGRSATRALLDSDAIPTAIICINDEVAVGALQALRAAGLAVPRDVSLVSFDDSPLAQVTEPPLTSIALPQEELGRTAAALLLAGAAPQEPVRIPMPQHAGGTIASPLA